MSRNMFWVVFLTVSLLLGILGAYFLSVIGTIVYIGGILVSIFAAFLLLAPVTGSNKDTFFTDKFLALLAILIVWVPYFLF